MLKRFIAFALFLALAVTFSTALHADSISYYATGVYTPVGGSISVTGTENSAIVATIPKGATRSILMIAALNHDTSNAKLVMLFDSATLPANGTIPLATCPVGPALAATKPAGCSFNIPADGLYIKSGIVVACSTTAKTLTVDTTSGGNCYFEVGYR